MTCYRVGLTGGIACGKSTVAEQLAGYGITVIDADAVVSELTAAGGFALPLLREQVGSWVIDSNGNYDRAAVRQQIFRRPALRRQIEAVLHPLVHQQMQQQIAAATGAYVLAVIPLLLESGDWRDYFQRVVVVDCSPECQQARVRQRDGRGDAGRIMQAQLTAAQRRRLADEVIDNNGDRDRLAVAVAGLHQRLLAAAEAAARRV